MRRLTLLHRKVSELMDKVRPRRRPAPAMAEKPSESYSRLALRLERDLAVADRGRSVLLTAADNDAVGVEAVTELAWHLAEELGHTVLMVDGTFGLGVLSRAFGLLESTGLIDLLATQQSSRTHLRAAALPTQHERIFLLPRGQDDNERMIAAPSEAIRALLETSCACYNFVLILGSVMDETSRSVAFGAFSDAALLIAVENKTLLHDIQDSQRILNESGAERVGLVLAVPPERPARGSRLPSP